MLRIYQNTMRNLTSGEHYVQFSALLYVLHTKLRGYNLHSGETLLLMNVYKQTSLATIQLRPQKIDCRRSWDARHGSWSRRITVNDVYNTVSVCTARSREAGVMVFTVQKQKHRPTMTTFGRA